MASSSALLSFLLLLASSSAWGMAHAHGREFTNIHMYMQEITAGPNRTSYVAVPSRDGGSSTFGLVILLDNELRDGPVPSNSSLVGRFQGMVAFAGLVTPPGMQSVLSFVFTSGEYEGSMLFMVGTILSFQHEFERAIVGGTGAFRMARGYSIIKAVGNTPVSTIYEVNLFVKKDD